MVEEEGGREKGWRRRREGKGVEEEGGRKKAVSEEGGREKWWRSKEGMKEAWR